ncbi:hypothetical protein ACP179_00480 (plasmid) [Xenorhabdus stockiae]|uniref:hypothetical protein n=1 Tax=Xenorhabdus stockiae TaxID=351614 RepID=UPI003CECDF58
MSLSLITLKAEVLETFSSSTKRFYANYSELRGNNTKRQKVMSVVRCGYIMEAAGLENLLSVIDTEEFFAADKNTRKDMIMRILSLNIGVTSPGSATSEMPNVKMETPPVVNPVPNQAELSIHHGTDTQLESTTSIIRDDDGLTRIIEQAPNKKSPLPAMSVLRANVSKK